jgi:hypothetical protein
LVTQPQTIYAGFCHYRFVTETVLAHIAVMTLREFLTEYQISPGQFAKEIGAAHRITVHRWQDGSRIPSRDYMRRIVAGTGGKVLPADFYEDFL